MRVNSNKIIFLFVFMISMIGLMLSPRLLEESKPENSLFMISPYKYSGEWVFDDTRVGLVREPFVAGIPEMIDQLVQDIPNAKEGFNLFFSKEPFPQHGLKLIWKRAEGGGNWYFSETYQKEGWLCPGLFKYYSQAPKEIYVMAKAR